MKKRVLTFSLVLSLILTMLPITGLAASDEAIEAAQALHELGLFNGVGTNTDGTPNFDLDRAPTRQEAITMLVRLLGKEEEAKTGTWETPFVDVDDWAKPYVGYAYTNGLTTGTGPDTFGGNDTVTATQYLTFILRALGYTSGTDFQWDKAWELSDKIELTDGRYNAETTAFARGDVAIISNNALNVKEKESETSLFERLVAAGTVTTEPVLPEPQKIDISWNGISVEKIEYQDKLYDYRGTSSSYSGGLYRSIFTDIEYDRNTGELYADWWHCICNFFAPFSIMDFQDKEYIVFDTSKLSDSYRRDTRFDGYPFTSFPIGIFAMDGTSFTTMTLQEFLDGDFSTGDSGVYKGIRFVVRGERVYYFVNDLADYFGINYHYSFSWENGIDVVVITDVEG